MICQKCKAVPAAVCITQIVDMKKTDIYLCHKCANEVAVAKFKEAFGLTGEPPGNLAFGKGYELIDPQAGELRCQGCGMTLAEIQSSGKLGCSNCYNVFRTQLRPIVARIHRSAQHRGKSPPGGPEAAGAKGGVGADFGAGSGASGDGTVGTKGGVAGGVIGASGAAGNKVGGAAGGTDGRDAAWPDSTDSTGANNGNGAGAGVDSGTDAGDDAANRLNALRAALAEAILNEEYEKAAEIRDRIKEEEKHER